MTCASGVTADEFRGFWVDSWGNGFFNQSQVNTLLGVVGDPNSKGQIRDANCNAIVAEVRRRADVCYPSTMGEPYMSGLSPSNFNALQAMINAAHDTTGGKKRIEVHCWIVTFRTATGVVYSRHNNPADPDNYWMTRDDTGVESSDKAFDPGHPKAEQYLVDVCMDLVNNYDIDGIHYDYIRFTGKTQGYNPTSIARYNARYGLSGQPAASDEQFKQWRRDQVSAVVRKVYAKIQAVKPWVKQSGSFVTWNPSPSSSTRAAFQATRPYYEVYSDWDSWMQEGIVDAGIPMTYYDWASLPTDYTKWMNFEKDRHGSRHMYIGPGTGMNSLSNAILELQMTRDASPAGNYADGFCGYSYRTPYSGGSWAGFSPSLVSDVTPTPDTIPVMSWKTSPTKGHIGGTVTYPPSGAWADGAIVGITGPEARTMRCDGTGFYAFIDLTPGVYSVTATYGAYLEGKTVTVTAGAIANGDIALVGTDPTAPVISNVQVSSITDGTAKITWSTDDLATSQVQYDFVPYYGQSTAEDLSKLTSHSVTLNGLTPNTTYNFRVKSTNAANLTSYSGDYAFTTQSVASAITVDEKDANCALSGSWIQSNNTNGYNTYYHYVSATHSGTATWTPSLPRTGPYDVLTFYVQGSNRATNAQYTVNYSGGSRVVAVNQRNTGNNWTVYLGTNLQFAMGSTGNVVLTNPSADGNVIADAVRFIYKGDLTPPVISSVTDDKYTTSTTSLQASWSGSDAQSGITLYKYAVGTLAGKADVKAWTDVGTATSAAIGGLSLTIGNTYYVSVRAVNGAGLTSAPLSSGGVTVAPVVGGVVEAKGLDDGQVVCFLSSSVTARFATKFYIEDGDRISGIRVESSTVVAPNQTAQVFGILGLADGCERAITDCKVIPGTAGPIVGPLAMVTKTVGGSALDGSTPGVSDGAGLNNVGLLVRVAGKVTAVVSDGFYLDDGCGVKDETDNIGIKVWTGTTNSSTVGAKLGVTGAVSCRSASGKVYPIILMREMNPF